VKSDIDYEEHCVLGCYTVKCFGGNHSLHLQGQRVIANKVLTAWFLFTSSYSDP
jgi:hypothetical protein